MMEEEFTDIMFKNSWGSKETVSGPGSTLQACRAILERLPVWIHMLGLKTIVDLGCGDFHWMSRVDLATVEYDGYEVVRVIAERNRLIHGRPNIRFHHRDITDMAVPQADLILLKDVLIHFPTVTGVELLQKILASGSTWLAATTSPGWKVSERQGLFVGGFSPADLSVPPYGLGPFQESVPVPHKEEHPEKFLALWNLKKLPATS